MLQFPFIPSMATTVWQVCDLKPLFLEMRKDFFIEVLSVTCDHKATLWARPAKVYCLGAGSRARAIVVREAMLQMRILAYFAFWNIDTWNFQNVLSANFDFDHGET